MPRAGHRAGDGAPPPPGAGPGDPDLITVRGHQLLERCDALVYDSLVPPSLVANSPAAEKHYVGKTEGGHALSQDEITQLLVETLIVLLLAWSSLTVVRAGIWGSATLQAAHFSMLHPGSKHRLRTP